MCRASRRRRAIEVLEINIAGFLLRGNFILVRQVPIIDFFLTLKNTAHLISVQVADRQAFFQAKSVASQRRMACEGKHFVMNRSKVSRGGKIYLTETFIIRGIEFKA